jgi:hypothetical protein
MNTICGGYAICNMHYKCTLLCTYYGSGKNTCILRYMQHDLMCYEHVYCTTEHCVDNISLLKLFPMIINTSNAPCILVKLIVLKQLVVSSKIPPKTSAEEA